MNRPLFALSSALLLASVAGCENQNSLAAAGPCEGASAMTAAPNVRLPSSQDLWSRTNGKNVYRPNQDGMSATSNAVVSVDALLEAMDVEMDLVETKSITGNSKQSGVFEAMGVLEPTEGDTMAWISTGVAGAGTSQSVDCSGDNIAIAPRRVLIAMNKRPPSAFLSWSTLA